MIFKNKWILLILILITTKLVEAQQFVNGSFENNTSNDCEFNLSNFDFNERMSGVYGNSEGFQQLDIQTYNCDVNPYKGDWCIGLASTPGMGYDMICIELSKELTPGRSYKLEFYAFGNDTYYQMKDSLVVGVSKSKTNFGRRIYVSKPIVGSWNKHSIYFTADDNFKYISVKVKDDFYNNSWVQLDYFTIKTISATFEAPDNLSFGNIPINHSETKSLVIKNTGVVNLNIASIKYPEGFSGDWNEGTISPGDSKEIQITFSPNENKDFTGTIEINSNASEEPVHIVVSGTGVNDPTSFGEEDQSILFNLYPNPAKTNIYLDVDADIMGEVFVITDLLGRVQIKGEIYQKKSKISIKSLSKGIYHLSVVEDQNLRRLLLKTKINIL